MIIEFQGKYRFLSNFYYCLVTYNGFTHKSSEHAYQAAKTTNESDFNLVANLNSPAETKRLTRRMKIRPDWDSVKLQIMREILICKFTQNEELKKKLLDTGDQELQEGNYWGDVYWGVCRGVGENHLGKLLMEIRSSLRIT